MADVHRRAAASAPRLTPEEVATRGFAAAFRGISELEVRNFLKRVADEMSATKDREADLRAQVDELREQLKHPPVVTEDRLLDALGEETARVLRSAQDAAEEIRSRAEATATAVMADADAAAATTRAEADNDAAAMRDRAQTAAGAREEEALAFATELRETATTEVADLRASTAAELTAAREASIASATAEIEAAKTAGRDLVNEARSVRERILADLGRRRMLLQAQIDELRAGRDRLLDAYRVVKRTLGDATQALGQVETRAADQLSGPTPLTEDVSPVDGELAALAGELTGEAGPVSEAVEALFARMRAEGAPTDPPDQLPPPQSADEPNREPEPDPKPEPKPKSESKPDPAREPTPKPKPKSATKRDPKPDPHPAPTSKPASGSAPKRAPKPEPKSNPEPPPPSPGSASETAPAPVATDPGMAGAVGGDAATDRDEPDAPPEISVTLTGSVTDDDARALRTAVLDPLHRELGRKVKRALQDEQNDVLDRIRTLKGKPAAETLLPAPTERVGTLAATMHSPVDEAFNGGRVAVGGAGPRQPVPAAMVDGLATALAERLRERLVEAIDDASQDDAVTQRLGARYREFKGQELDAVVGDTLAAAWALGVYEGAPAGQTLRWVPSSEGNCPDCDDNALEPTVRGKDFPTGQPHPPAHPGCRCLLVPVW